MKNHLFHLARLPSPPTAYLPGILCLNSRLIEAVFYCHLSVCVTVLRQDRLLTEVHIIGRCCADLPNHSHLTEGATDHIREKPHTLSSDPTYRVPISSLRCNPGVLKDFLGRVTLEGVDNKAPAYQLLGRVGHIVPVGRIKLKETGEDLIKELLLVVGAA